jgi:hypothetical protein
MAEPHHTAPGCLSGLPDYLFAHLPSVAREGLNIDEKARTEIDFAVMGIDLVKRAITCLLADSDAYSEAITVRAPIQPRSWPLPAPLYSSLLVAIDFLNECTGMLTRELTRR